MFVFALIGGEYLFDTYIREDQRSKQLNPARDIEALEIQKKQSKVGLRISGVSDPKFFGYRISVIRSFSDRIRISVLINFGYGYPIQNVISGRISDPCSPLITSPILNTRIWM